jgi:hypothetical protein
MLRDIKGPLDLPQVFNFWWLLVVAAAIIIWFLFKFWPRKQKAAEPEIKRPAHLIALEELEALVKRDLLRQGKVKEYYSGVSDIIRHYLENRFALKAPEMTTEEFLYYARAQAPQLKTYRDTLKEFLVACDMVKFAKYLPQDEDNEIILQTARKFIEETKEPV